MKKIVVKTEIYRNYRYYITSIYSDEFNIKWYCAYIRIPPFYKCCNMEITPYIIHRMNVHGGITFLGDICFNESIKECFCLGWDYAHCYDNILYNQHCYKLTVEEIEEECKNAIDQLISLDKSIIRVYDLT